PLANGAALRISLWPHAPGAPAPGIIAASSFLEVIPARKPLIQIVQWSSNLNAECFATTFCGMNTKRTILYHIRLRTFPFTNRKIVFLAPVENQSEGARSLAIYRAI